MSVCVLQLGEAVTKNPGYLKLRKIRAAQTIAKTVRDIIPKLIFSFIYSFIRFIYQGPDTKYYLKEKEEMF